LEQEVWVQPGERALIPTGIALALPPGCLGLVFARSGLAWRSGLALANGVGVIDSDYRGEIMVPVINLGTEPVRLEPGDRIAQIVICEGGRALFGELPALERTERGAGGFGSSGVK
jgi:dUTP pyrophosphatase